MNKAGMALAAGANMLDCRLILETDYQTVKTAAVHVGLINVTGAVRSVKDSLCKPVREMDDLLCPNCGLSRRRPLQLLWGDHPCTACPTKRRNRSCSIC